MEVALEEHTGKSFATGRVVRFEQYRIRVDGEHAGFIGYAPGSKILLQPGYSPRQQAEIELQISKILGLTATSGVAVAPEIPMSIKQNQLEEIDVDDLD